jgi:hypothetical protein
VGLPVRGDNDLLDRNRCQRACLLQQFSFEPVRLFLWWGRGKDGGMTEGLAGDQPKVPSDVFTAQGVGRYLFHYTRLDSAIEHILPSRLLRFSRLATMRDPRESLWAFGASFFGDLPDSDVAEALGAVQRLHQNIRLISLTADDEGRNLSPCDAVFARGFSHPRLWEQYADRHRGVCLCFECEKLTQSVTETIENVGGPLYQGRVTYRDGGIAAPATGVILSADRSSSDLAAEHFVQHVDELCFTKLTDWETEVEYRYVTLSYGDQELFVDISTSLAAVLTGRAVAEEYGPALQALTAPSVDLRKLEWWNGRPIDVRFGQREETII